MPVEIDFDSRNRYIQVKGELVASTVMEALELFARECRKHPEWVIDLTRVSRVDSTALALLIELKRRAASNQRKISFIYLPESLLTIARLSQVEDLLTTAT
jgi:anti-anti-sigma factor